MARYYTRSKRVAETSAGVYGDEWVCTMESPERAAWMADQLNKAEVASDLLDVIQRIRQWDHLDSAGDGPYWKFYLDAAIAKATGQAELAL